MNDFLDFRKLLPQAIARYNMERQTRASQVCARFRKIAPHLLKETTGVEPRFYKNKKLYVRVKNSIDAQRVFVKRHELLEELNEGFPRPIVSDVRALIG